MRIDRLLCYLRICRTRTIAQKLVEQGHIRCNRRRVARTSACIRPGDVLTFPLGENIRAIHITALPVRRGPAIEAQAHYRWLDLHP